MIPARGLPDVPDMIKAGYDSSCLVQHPEGSHPSSPLTHQAHLYPFARALIFRNHGERVRDKFRWKKSWKNREFLGAKNREKVWEQFPDTFGEIVLFDFLDK